MATQSSSINYRQAAQVAAAAIVYGVIPPSDPVSQIGAFALGVLACKGVDFIAPYVKAYKCAFQLKFYDLPKSEKIKNELENAKEKIENCPMEAFCFVNDNIKFLELVKKGLPSPNQMDFRQIDTICFTHPEIGTNVMEHLAIQDIACFAATSRSCFLVAKIDGVWEHQLNKLFPGLKTIPFQECRFTCEQQVKMIYKKLPLYLKLLKKQYQEDAQTVLRLRGPTGFDGEIDRAWKQLQSETQYLSVYEAEYLRLNSRLAELVGDSYDGTENSIDSQSKQGAFQRWIKQITDETNQMSQEKFKEFIFEEKKFKQHHDQMTIKILELNKHNTELFLNLQELNKNLAIKI